MDSPSNIKSFKQWHKDSLVRKYTVRTPKSGGGLILGEMQKSGMSILKQHYTTFNLGNMEPKNHLKKSLKLIFMFF